MLNEQHLDKYIKITVWSIVVVIVLLVGSYYYFYKKPSVGKKSIIEQQITEFQKRVKKKPKDLTARYYLARAYLKNKQYDDSINELKEILKVEKESQQTYLVLGLAYKQKGESSYGDAEKQFQKVIDLSKKKEYANVNSNLKSAYYFVGEISFKRKKYKKALDNFLKSSRIGSNDSDSFRYIGRSYFMLKNYKKAEQFFKEAIRFVPNYAEVYYDLGKLYQVQGEKGKAKNNYKKALKYKSNYQEAKEALGSI